MDISNGEEINILLTQLQERCNACHKMRDRSTQFALWILGFGLGMAWLLISGPALTIQQKIAIFLFLLLVGFVSFLFIRAIERGFNRHREIIIRIETLLKLHEGGSYGSEHPILPGEFLDKKVKWSGHFPTLYYLMGLVLVLLIVLVWINPCRGNSASGPASGQIQEVQDQNVVKE